MSDSYEIGTNCLFDDRTQELIIHDEALRAELPRQEPDRVFGLRATRNIGELLSRPIAFTPEHNGNGALVLADILRTSPFKPGPDPLLFPFLLLEAKAEKSKTGFYGIQIQSAFPLWALLRLQEELQLCNQESEPSFSPLVWFIATRGDAWKVYGCYLTKEGRGVPVQYVSIIAPFWLISMKVVLFMFCTSRLSQHN